MKDVRILLLLTCCLWLPFAQAQAQAQNLKIGFVNAAKILDEAPQAAAARNRLQKEFEPRNKGLEDAATGLRRLEDKLARDGAVMADSERRKLERNLIAQQRELKRSQSEFREDFNIRRNEELGKLQRLVYEAIIQLAKEQNFDLIVNDGAVVYASEQVDITDSVLQRLK